MRMQYKLLIGCFLLLASLSVVLADEQYAMVRQGFYSGLSFGNMMTHYSDDLDRYAASSGNQDAAGSNYALTAKLGYNVNKVYGLQMGLLHYQDNANGSSATVTRKSKLELNIVDVVTTFHLKLNDSRNWVATPKVGLALEQGKLNYQYIDSTGATQSPWAGGSSVNSTQKKIFITPTAGMSFDHSFNSNWVMSFEYQYFFGGTQDFGDPYQSKFSSIHYFSVGGDYKF